MTCVTQIYFLNFVEAQSVTSEPWRCWLTDGPLYTASARDLSFVCIWCFVVHSIPVIGTQVRLNYSPPKRFTLTLVMSPDVLVFQCSHILRYCELGLQYEF